MIQVNICGEPTLDIERTTGECSSGCISVAMLSDYYTKTQADNLLDSKQDALTKDSLLSLIGYREAIMRITDCDGNEREYSILVEG